MCNMENNLRFTWQLVSQFVSWDFCRFMCEESENITSDIDVLTFLRNMIVKRTEKSMSDITQHEIIAKFIMEIKAVKDLTRLPCIIALSESVIKICPELQMAVDKLIHHMKAFLKVLDNSEEPHKQELIRLRIEDAILDFCKEAGRLLPQPDLMQVVESWKHHHGYSNPKPSKNVTYDPEIFENVLACLHIERIMQSEAKLIAVSLHEDKTFERILQNILENTEADSDQISDSRQSSQPNGFLYSQEFVKGSQQSKSDEIPSYLLPPNNDSLQLDSPPLEPNRPPDFSSIHGNSPDPVPVVDVVPSPVQSDRSDNLPYAYEQEDYIKNHHDIDQNISKNKRNSSLQNQNEIGDVQFALSSAQESDSDEDIGILSRINSRINNLSRREEPDCQNQSDSDTSDCDKNTEVRFLTPTLYKQGNPPRPRTQPNFLSDSESNNSSVITMQGIDSQQNDPNWTLHSPSPRNAPSNLVKKKNIKKTKNVVPLSGSDDDEIVTAVNVPVDNLSRVAAVQSAFGQPTKRRRIALSNTVKLYRSPNISIDDFHILRKPVSVAPSNIAIHQSTNTSSGELSKQKTSRIWEKL